VYDPAGATVTEALPLQLAQVAGTDEGVTVSAVEEGQVVHVVVLKYNPDIQRLKQSPPVLTLYVAEAAPVATVVFTVSKFHQFQVSGTAVPFAVQDVGLN